MSPAPLTLAISNKNLSSWSLRPWLLLTQAGIPFTEQMVYFGALGWQEQVASPSGRVPLLRIGEGPAPVAVWESLAICETIADLFPEKHLWPRDPLARAHARSVSNEMHAGFGDLRSECSMNIGLRTKKRLSRGAAANVARIDALWSDCRAKYGGAGPFLFGGFSVADAMYAPVVYRFQSYGVELSPPAQADADMLRALPAMQAWEAAAKAELDARIDDPNPHGPLFSRAEIEQFTHDWAHAWRAKDLEKILTWFADDVCVNSPGAEELTGSALVEGKPALRAFWTKALLHDQPIVYEVEGFTWDPETNSLLLRYQSGAEGRALHRAAGLLRFGNGRTVVRADAYSGA